MANRGDSQQAEGIEYAVNRRRFLTGTGLAGVAGLAGCSRLTGSGTNDDGGSNNDGSGGSGGSNGDSEDETTKESNGDSLSYWTLFGGGDGETMKQMVGKVNDETDLSVERQRVPFGEYYDRLYTSLTGGEAPDIAVIHADGMEGYKDFVVPINEYIDESAYVDSIVERCKVDGELLSAPLDTHPYGLWYNKDLFEEAGLDPEDAPDSPERFAECCQAISENTDAWAGQIHAGGLSTIVFHMWLRSLGSPMLTDDNTAGFNNDDGVAVAEFYDQVVNEKGWVPQSSEKGWKAWNNGEAGFLFDGTWHLGVVRQNDFDFGLAKPFTIPGADNHVTSGNSHTLAILKNPDRSEEQTKKAAEVIKHLTQDYNMLWGKDAGHLPAFSDALNSDELQSSKAWDQSLSTFHDMATNGEIAYMPKTTNNGEYQEQIWQQLNAVRQDKKPAEEAIQAAAEGVNQVFQ